MARKKSLNKSVDGSQKSNDKILLKAEAKKTAPGYPASLQTKTNYCYISHSEKSVMVILTTCCW